MTITRVALLTFLVVGCSRPGAKATDTAAVAGVDSASSNAPSPVPQSASPTTDSTKAAPAPIGGATSPATPTPTATPSETVLTGRVTVGGLAGQQRTTLQVEGGSPTLLTGALEPELRRLNAATVLVAGAPGAAAPSASFAVSRYEVLSIEGSTPLVGTLTVRDGSTWLVVDRDTLKLSSTTPEIRAKVGAKVWIVGRRSGA